MVLLQPSHVKLTGSAQRLYGHNDVITALHVCKPFSVMVSASHDKTLIIWDLNRCARTTYMHMFILMARKLRYFYHKFSEVLGAVVTHQ